MARTRILVICLGKSSLGIQFSEILARHSHEIEFDILFRKTDVIHLNDNMIATFPKSKLMQILNQYRFTVFKKKLNRVIKDANYKAVFIPFPHPWDVKLQLSNVFDVPVIRIIHDGIKHPGDFWPRNKTIKKISSRSLCMFLSDYVAKLVKTNNYIVTSHPILYDFNQVSFEARRIKDKYFLVVGRLKKYQGTTRILKWWKNEGNRIFQNYQLILVSNRKNILLQILSKFARNISYQFGNVSDNDFLSYLINSTAVLCLYKEASQSGIVAIAKNLGVPLLVTDVGALPSQISEKDFILRKNYNDIEVTSALHELVAQHRRLDAENIKHKARVINESYAKSFAKLLESGINDRAK